MRVAIVTVVAVVALLAGCARPEFSRLEGSVSRPDAQHVLVQGQTDLPDRAQILVTVLGGRDGATVVQGLPTVKDGRFQTLLVLPTASRPDAYRVRMTFSPAAYDWSRGKVTAAVGSKGEHLTGPQALRDGELTVLQRELPLDLPKGGEVK